MTKRRYTLRRRAGQQAETRRRIVEAAAHLHEELGPRATTITAIAERAGVQRLTVYRHFPDEKALFEACTSHWLALHPAPDPVAWSDRQGFARVRAALLALYGYYRRTERMWIVSYRDEADVPGLQEPMRRVGRYLKAVEDDLVEHLPPDAVPTEKVRATLAHAVAFSTWQSLAGQGLDGAAIADLVCDWIGGAAASAAR